MSTAERLQTMKAIWDSLLYENEDIESPEWHNKIIEKRIAKIKGGKAKFISLSDLFKNVQARFANEFAPTFVACDSLT